jgi:hypothetical protein
MMNAVASAVHAGSVAAAADRPAILRSQGSDGLRRLE